jgi:copper chaperone CopZ
MAETALTIKGMFCAGCAHHVKDALGSVPGVQRVEVNLSEGLAHVAYDPVQANIVRMMGAVAAAGYEAAALQESHHETGTPTLETLIQKSSLEVPILSGIAGTAVLFALYLLIISIAESPSHALQQLGQDAGFVSTIALGFGIQIGLFVHLRTNIRRAAAAAALPAGSGGVSATAMLACCAHHLADVLPFLGLTAAAVFLNEYRGWFMAAGLALTVMGIGFMIYTIRKVAASCALAGSSVSAAANPTA